MQNVADRSKDKHCFSELWTVLLTLFLRDIVRMQTALNWLPIGFCEKGNGTSAVTKGGVYVN
jgi:hypothetical protein